MRIELIQSNEKIENSLGLHNWMTHENLKVIARDYANTQESYDGISNLSAMLDKVTKSMETYRSELRAIEDRMKLLSTVMEYSKANDKESIFCEHESDIWTFETINL